MGTLLGFFEGIQPLEKCRVRVMPTRIEPVVNRKTKVIQVELDQRRLEIDSMAELFGELVCFKLKMPAK